MHQGSCLCGDVTYSGAHLREAVTACHCGQCRKVSGMFWAATRAQLDDLEISGPVKWYRSSEKAERGFCPGCGSALFYHPIGADHMAVAPGSIDGPSGLTLTNHIFTAHRGDYYEIADGLPQRED